MRLFGPYIFILIGVAISFATTWLFTSNPMRLAPNLVLGILGSFFGLWLRDILDLHLGGNMTGALIGAAVGALLFTVPVNIMMSMRQERKRMD